MKNHGNKKKSKVADYLSLVKFSHTIFAMPFAVIGFFLAIRENESVFDYKLFLLVIGAMVFARNAAMAFNRYIDREIDFKNPRTAIREIPSGLIKAKSALWFVIINSILFLIVTYFINILCFYLAPIALLIILGYSLTKKFTFLCHFILGLGLSLSPIGAYLAVSGKFNLLPILFSFIVLFWVSGFDIIYSLQDVNFDKEEKLKSIPVKLGKRGALLLSRIVHFFAAALVVFIGIHFKLGYFYWIGSGIFISLLMFQQLLVRPNDLSKLNLAFFTTNGIASVIFSVFVVLSIILN